MKTYKVIYTESLFHVFYVEAESEEKAREEFDRKAYNGELDYSDGEVYDSGVESVEEVK
jgi:DNA-dependent RNA polymerase auxiliary subunit epsilon